MAVLQQTRMVLGDGNNGTDTDALQLFQTRTKVFVHFANGVAGTLTLKHGSDESLLITEKVPDENNWLATITSSITFTMDGPGVIKFGCADITGAITVVIEEVIP